MSDPRRSVAGLVLAAGAGRRLGRAKADLVVDGLTLLERATSALREGGAVPVLAVVQPAGTGAGPAVSGTRLVENAEWESGMGSSLRAGLAALRDDAVLPADAADAVVLTLVDTPGVGPEHVRRLLAAHAAGARVAVAAYDGTLRTPALVGREHWPEVARLAAGDVGARAFLRRHPELAVPVECGDLGPWTDVDTVEDLRALGRAPGTGHRATSGLSGRAPGRAADTRRQRAGGGDGEEAQMSETQSGPTQSGGDVVDVLTTDHHEVLDLIAEIWTTQDPARRRDLADVAISEVVRHSVAEEMYVYPVMRDRLPDGEQAVQHDIEEHKELERTMKQLESVDPSDVAFTEHLRDFERLLRDHVQDEEGEQFPKLRAHVSAEELRELAGKVETAKKLAPTRPHPMAPNHELFHKTVGPGAGLVDRLRDKLTGRATG